MNCPRWIRYCRIRNQNHLFPSVVTETGAALNVVTAPPRECLTIEDDRRLHYRVCLDHVKVSSMLEIRHQNSAKNSHDQKAYQRASPTVGWTVRSTQYRIVSLNNTNYLLSLRTGLTFQDTPSKILPQSFEVLTSWTGYFFTTSVHNQLGFLPSHLYSTSVPDSDRLAMLTRGPLSWFADRLGEITFDLWHFLSLCVDSSANWGPSGCRCRQDSQPLPVQ